MLLTSILTLTLALSVQARDSDILVSTCGRLPLPLLDTTVVGDNQGSIYVLGGGYKNVFEFNTVDHSIETVGTFPSWEVAGGQAEIHDSTGDIFYFDGRTNFLGKSGLYKLAEHDRNPRKIRRPKLQWRRGQTTVKVDDSVFIFGGDACGLVTCKKTTIELYNMTSNEVRTVGWMSRPKHIAKAGAVYDGNYIYLFGGKSGGLQVAYDTIIRFDPRTFEIETLETRLPRLAPGSSAVLVNDIAYIFPGSSKGESYEHIMLFNTTDHSIHELSLNEGIYSRRGNVLPSVYVKEQNRIYLFGAAFNYSAGYQDIICLDLPFECTGRSDGLYANARDCSKFFMCSSEVKHEMECPGNLYFNPETERCDFRENVNCGSA